MFSCAAMIITHNGVLGYSSHFEHDMKASRSMHTAGLLFLCVVLPSCARDTAQGPVKEYPVAKEFSFAVPFEDAWKGTIRAASEEERIITLEREAGVIVTEYRPVNHRVQPLVAGSLFGGVYKNGYTITLREIGPKETLVGIQAKMFLEQVTGHSSEQTDDSLTSYMRQELFRKICLNLLPDKRKCPELFPDYHMLSVSCPAGPAPEAEGGAVARPASLPESAATAKRASIKQVQQALVKAGYTPGAVDGRLGPKTRAAIASLQVEKGREGTGELDWPTMQLLGF
ncbi:MAG: peptidoglycan-binding protein [Desulforhopalus sp.]|nr:peptidoglycan-binding protein [Desulforhopalus sp.]